MKQFVIFINTLCFYGSLAIQKTITWAQRIKLNTWMVNWTKPLALATEGEMNIALK